MIKKYLCPTGTAEAVHEAFIYEVTGNETNKQLEDLLEDLNNNLESDHGISLDWEVAERTIRQMRLVAQDRGGGDEIMM